MKNLLPLLLVFLAQLSYSQNWAPISINNKYNYIHDSAASIINTIWVDSVQALGNDSIFFLNRIVKTNRACDSILNSPNPDKQAYCDLCRGWKNQPQFLQRKVIKHSNGIYNFRDSANFVINSLAGVNEPWVFDTLNSINAMVTDIIEGVFFNVTDSAKIIFLENGPSMILSKNYGIIQFPDWVDSGTYYFVGIENLGIGIKTLGFWEFFDHEVGSEFCKTSYFEDNENGWSDGITKISITSKQAFSDSIIYGLSSIAKYDGLSYWSGPYSNVSTNVYNRTYRNNPQDGYNLYNNQLYQLHYDYSDGFENGYYFVKLHRLSNGKYEKTLGPRTSPGFDVFFRSTPNSDELYPKCGHFFHYLTYLEGEGLKEETKEYQAPDSLIGMGLGYKSYNTYSFASPANVTPNYCLPHNISVNENEANQFTLSPNPVNGLFELSFEKPIEGEISIYNQTGQLVYTEPIVSLKRKIIDVSQLPAGIYLVNVRSEKESVSSKLMINR